MIRSVDFLRFFMLPIGIAVCYFGAFLLELFRFVRCNRWAALPAGIGFVIHSLFLTQQHLLAEHPLGGAQMYFFTSAWGLLLVYLFWSYKYPNIPFGLVILPIAVLLIFGGIGTVHTIETATPSFRPLLKMFHSGTFFLTTLNAAIGFVAGIFYFHQDYLLRKKYLSSEKFKFPALEWSFTVCRLSFGFFAACLLIGIFTGSFLMQANILPDSLIIGSWVFFLLFFVSSLWFFNFRTRKNYLVAAWTLILFLFLLFVLFVTVYSENVHWNGITPPH